MFMSLSPLFEAGIRCDNEAHIHASDVLVCDTYRNSGPSQDPAY